MTGFALQDATCHMGGRIVLHPLSLAIPAGGVTGLIGHNGSGKSSLMRLLGRRVLPSGGGIRLDGTPLAKFGSRAFARRVAYLPQVLPPSSALTVRELVQHGRYPWRGALGRYRTEDKLIVERAMHDVDIDAFADRDLPTLSGGERQRAWLAMTLAQETEFLLLDEPVSALDLAHQLSTMALVRRLSRDRKLGVVVVLHDINLAARYCDTIVALSNGGVVAQGTPDALLQPDVLRRIHGVEMLLVPHPGTGGPVALAA